MSIHSIMNQIQQTKWTKINNFGLTILFNNEKFKKYCKWEFSEDQLNSALISFNTPQYQTAPIEEYVGYEWRINQGRLDVYRFSITFRDFNQMLLYETFRNMFVKSSNFYFNDIKLTIQVRLDSDNGLNEKFIFQTTTAIIESISQLQFSHNTENQVAEFTVAFKCNINELGNESKLESGVAIPSF